MKVWNILIEMFYIYTYFRNSPNNAGLEHKYLNKLIIFNVLLDFQIKLKLLTTKTQMSESLRLG